MLSDTDYDIELLMQLERRGRRKLETKELAAVIFCVIVDGELEQVAITHRRLTDAERTRS